MKTNDTPDVLPEIDDNCVNLDQPIKRGTSEITSITLRKPSSGELRGVLLIDLLNMDVSSLIKVIPRISSPGITAPEAAGMDPADLLAIGSKIASFLLQKSVKTDVFLVA
ncbi:phage tail assembly protein [Pseudomonas fragi]|uniref:phage tail assembly protein n=1 Tax=Pseudomonas fragi TaxID=296 RepID=UPI001474B539|nr:phage tail assembly protein [Pseudomonas fragi]NNB04307.1 phage tail assembly protein [Pseudomonas fragi]